MALFKTAPITTDPLEILKYFSDMKASKGDKKRDGIMADSGFVGEETDTASLDWLASTFDKFREAKDNAKIDLETRRTSEENLALRDRLDITQSRDKPYSGLEDLDKLRMQMDDLGIAKRNGLPAQPEIEEVALPKAAKPELTTDILLKMLKEIDSDDTKEETPNVDAIGDPSDESTFGEDPAPVEDTKVPTGEGLMSRPSYDKEAMLDNNEPEGEGGKAEGVRVDSLINEVLSLEGGYSKDTADTGNYLGGDTSTTLIGTNHGISADILKEHLGKTPTAADMKALTKKEARGILKKKYWDKFSVGVLPKDLQPIVFNAVVNSGSHAVKVMQELLGVTADGAVGPKTIEKMKTAAFTKKEFKDDLLKKYKTFKTWKDHGKGWTKRFTDLAKA